MTLEENMVKGHLWHPEDAVLEDGSKGARRTVDYLESFLDELAGHSNNRKFGLNLKWDGSPSTFCGYHDGEFFVTTKSIFNKKPKLYKSNQEIDADKKRPPAVKTKLKLALKYFPEINPPKNVIISGDYLFDSGELYSTTIDGEDVVAFTPNTITYAVPIDSELADDILDAKLGIVFHTTWVGDIGNLKPKFSFDASKLKRSKNVWVSDARIKDYSGVITFTNKETRHVKKMIEVARKLSKNIDNKFLDYGKIKILLPIFLNWLIRSGKSITDSLNFLELWKEFLFNRKENTEDILQHTLDNINSFRFLILFIQQATAIKVVIIDKLNLINQKVKSFVQVGDGFSVTPGEGFVVSDTDGNVVKFVDRLTFSRLNFNNPKFKK